MDMDIDEIQTWKMLGLASYSPCYGMNNLTSFLSNNPWIDKKELRYNSQKDTEEKEFKLSSEEEKLRKILEIEHNTVDLLNENMKLKELLRYLQTNCLADLAESWKSTEEQKMKVEDLENKIKEKEKLVEKKEQEAETVK